MSVIGDKLVGTKANGQDEDLTNSVIALVGPPVGRDLEREEYQLTILEVNDSEFWTERRSGVRDYVGAPKTTPIYKFMVTSSSGGCSLLCKPDLTDRTSNLSGTAVIFIGDVYDDNGFKARSVDGNSIDESLKPEEKDLFNIACYGTAISKLHFLRHTSAAMGSSMASGKKTTVNQRQAMLRLLTADYCGIGFSFTENAHPIGLDFDSSAWDPISKVGLASERSIDAMWAADGTRASCIGTPRLTDTLSISGSIPLADAKAKQLAAIRSKCPALADCTADRLGNAVIGKFGGDYAASANAF